MTQRLEIAERSREGEKILIAAHNPVDKGTGDRPIHHQKARQEANTFTRKKGAKGEKNRWIAVQECRQWEREWENTEEQDRKSEPAK